tara:strand:- start:173 stop:583 length:411 start_codon:yes stop_codon:yes gene_type:complete
MAAGKYSFTIEQGTTVDFELQYQDSSNIPIDLTGYTGAMSIRSTYSGSGTTYLALTSLTGSEYANGKPTGSAFLSISGSNLSTPPSSGSIGVYVGFELTDSLTFTTAAYYDIELTSGSIRTRILEGRVNLSQQVTY